MVISLDILVRYTSDSLVNGYFIRCFQFQENTGLKIKQNRICITCLHNPHHLRNILSAVLTHFPFWKGQLIYCFIVNIDLS